MKSFRFLALALAMSLPLLAQTSTTSPTAGEKLSKSEIRSLVATASTAEQHNRLARYFAAESRRYAAEAQDHIFMEGQYRKNPMMNNNKRSQATVGHCDYIAKSLNEASVQASELAKMHEAMASDSGKK